MKYIKYFEGFGEDQDELNALKFLDDPIVGEIYRQVYIHNNTNVFWDHTNNGLQDTIGNAMWLYTHNNNNGPLCDHMDNLFREVNFSPLNISNVDPKYDQLSKESKLTYWVLKNVDICKTILSSLNAFKILTILKDKDINLFNYIKNNSGEDTINMGNDMGELGFN